MALYVLIWLALVAGAGLLIWLARRALRLRNPGARWALAVLATAPALLLAATAALIANGYYQFYRPRTAPAIELAAAAGPEQIARGAHLARTTCAACHSQTGDLPLSGGVDLSSHSPVPIGVMVPPNLTPGGPLAGWSDAEIAQAIRNGRHQNGRTLLMPTASLRNLSDDDLAALIAFLRSQPAVQNDTPESMPSPLLAFFLGTGLVELNSPPVEGPVVAPQRERSVAYGRYVASYQDCRTCHGERLEGSSGGLTQPAPSARAFARAWTEEEFIRTMRTGIDPGGHQVQEPMPWEMIGRMDDLELAALYAYLRSEEE